MTPELYHHVLIDSSKRVFDEELDLLCLDGRGRRNPVVIRSLFALSRFFKTLMLHPEYGRYLQQLRASETFPDMPQCELNRFLELISPSLTNLMVLEWYAQECPLNAQILHLLPSISRLHTLCGNFIMPDYFFRWPAASRLRELDVSNFTSPKALAQIDLAQYPELRSLKVARCSSSINTLVAVSSAKNYSSLDTLAPTSYLGPLLNLLRTRIRLKSLKLADLPVSCADADLVVNSICLSELELFSLVNCTEWFVPTEVSLPGTVAIRRGTPPSRTFFKRLSPHLSNLVLLHYDVSNNFCDNASIFGSLAQFTKLKKLAVRIHLYRSNGAVDLTPYINKIHRHATTLEHLDISCTLSDSPSGPVCPIQSQAAHVKLLVALSSFTKLKSLSLPVIAKQLPELAESWTNSELRVLRLAVTDQSLERLSTCNDCTFRPIYDVYNSACLVSQEFFACPTSFSSEVVDSNDQRYLTHTMRFRELLPHLAYVRFDFKLLSLLFNCRSTGQIELKDGSFLNQYESLVDGAMKCSGRDLLEKSEYL